MSISTDSLIPLIQVFILKTVHYLCSPQCNVAVSTQGPHDTLCHIITTCTIHICLSWLKSEKQKFNSGHRLSLQSNRNIKCEILKYARCWLCDTEHWGSQVWDIVTAEIWNAHYTPDDASGSVLTVCRPLIGHSVQTLPSHWLIKWWILFTLGTKEKMMSSKNVWVDNIHECLGMKTRMAISQFYSDPVPRTRTWLLTRAHGSPLLAAPDTNHFN